MNQKLAQEALEELQGLARNIDREFYKVNEAIEEAEADIDMDAIVDEVLDNLELDGREVSCSSTPDAPDIDLDIDTEALETAIARMNTRLEELAEELETAPEAPLEAPQGITLTAEEVELITSALTASRELASEHFTASRDYLRSLGIEASPLAVMHVEAQEKRMHLTARLRDYLETTSRPTANTEGDSMA